jgi:hypothetical protein
MAAGVQLKEISLVARRTVASRTVALTDSVGRGPPFREDLSTEVEE